MNSENKTDEMQLSLIEKNSQRSNYFPEIFFFMLGVSSLTGWNAILTGLSYFADKYEGHNVYFIMPIPNFIGSFIIGLFLPRISSQLSMLFKVVWSLSILCLLLILLPIIAQEIQITIGINSNYPQKGYSLCLVTIFIMALFQSIFSYSCIGISNIIGPKYLNLYFTGTGASGVIICIFRIISLASMENQESIFLYIGISVAWNVCTIIMYFKFAKKSHYKLIIEAQKNKSHSILVINEFKDDKKNMSQIADSIQSGSAIQNIRSKDSQPSEENQQSNQISFEKMNVIQTLVSINKIAFPIPFLIMILYTQTFMMFPGVACQKTFHSDFINWGQSIIILGFNLGDTLGKFLAKYRKLFSLQILIGLFLARFAFYYTFILIVKSDQDENWISYLNTFSFGTLNGFITAGYMILGSEKTNIAYIKEKIGFAAGFSLSLGMMIGTFLALPLSDMSN